MSSKIEHFLSGSPLSSLDGLTKDKRILELLIDRTQAGEQPYKADTNVTKVATGAFVQFFDAFSPLSDGRVIAHIVLAHDVDQMDRVQQWAALGVKLLPFSYIDEVMVHTPSAFHVASWDKETLLALDVDENELTFDDVVVDVSATVSDHQRLAQTFAALRLISREAEALSKEFEAKIAALPQSSELDDEPINLGVARTYLSKAFDPEKVDAKVIELMEKLNYSSDDIERFYQNNDNFWKGGEFDFAALRKLIQHHLGVDIEKDPRFSTAIVEEKKPNLETRLEYLKDIASKNKDEVGEINWDDLLDPQATVVKTELVREAPKGPTKELREAISAGLRDNLLPLASLAGGEYAQIREKIIQAQPSKKSKSKKSP